MAEWSIAAVLKTVEVRASGGSNPSLPATQLRFHTLFYPFSIVCRDIIYLKSDEFG